MVSNVCAFYKLFARPPTMSLWSLLLLDVSRHGYELTAGTCICIIGAHHPGHDKTDRNDHVSELTFP